MVRPYSKSGIGVAPIGNFVALEARTTPNILAKLLLEGYKDLELERGRARCTILKKKHVQNPQNLSAFVP